MTEPWKKNQENGALKARTLIHCRGDKDTGYRRWQDDEFVSGRMGALSLTAFTLWLADGVMVSDVRHEDKGHSCRCLQKEEKDWCPKRKDKLCRGNHHTNCFSSEASLLKCVSHTFEGFAPSTLVEELPQNEKKGIKNIFKKTTYSHRQYNLT